MPVNRTDLRRAWDETAARFDFSAHDLTPGRESKVAARERSLEDRVEERLTERAATFQPGELRAVLLEQSAGELAPREALGLSKAMVEQRRILPLEGGLMTTLTVRAREEAIERRFSGLAGDGGRDVGERARMTVGDRVAERIGSSPQRRADRRAPGHHRSRARRDPCRPGRDG